MTVLLFKARNASKLIILVNLVIPFLFWSSDLTRPLTLSLSLQFWEHDEQGEAGVCQQGGPREGHPDNHHQQHRLHRADVRPQRGTEGKPSSLLPLCSIPSVLLCLFPCTHFIPVHSFLYFWTFSKM